MYPFGVDTPEYVYSKNSKGTGKEFRAAQPVATCLPEEKGATFNRTLETNGPYVTVRSVQSNQSTCSESLLAENSPPTVPILAPDGHQMDVPFATVVSVHQSITPTLKQKRTRHDSFHPIDKLPVDFDTDTTDNRTDASDNANDTTNNDMTLDELSELPETLTDTHAPNTIALPSFYKHTPPPSFSPILPFARPSTSLYSAPPPKHINITSRSRQMRTTSSTLASFTSPPPLSDSPRWRPTSSTPTLSAYATDCSPAPIPVSRKRDGSVIHSNVPKKTRNSTERDIHLFSANHRITEIDQRIPPNFRLHQSP